MMMLTWLAVVISLQYTQMSNHYIIHLKLIQYYVSYISLENEKETNKIAFYKLICIILITFYILSYFRILKMHYSLDAWNTGGNYMSVSIMRCITW